MTVPDLVATRAFGPAGLAPVIGQGTWNLEQVERAQALRALARGLDLGLTHIDTAEMYGLGEVEETVGIAIRGRRDRVFLVSKVLPRNASREGVVRACESSLRRLGTDRLDSYLLHYPTPEHPLEETVAALEQLVSDGKIRSWGVSNFDVDALEEVVRLAGPGRVACDQVLYHLGARYVEGALHASCVRHEVALVGYSPFGSGRFPSPRSAGGRALESVAMAHAATPRQVALAFLTRLDSTFTIPKAAEVHHIEEIAAAGSLRLDAAEVARLDAVFPRRGSELGFL